MRIKELFIVIILGVAILTLLLIAIKPSSLEANIKTNFTKLTLTGTGVVTTTPSQATIRVGVEITGDNAQLAFKEASNIANKILNSWIEVGIPKEKIKTHRVSLDPVYEYSDRSPRLVGFKATIILSASLTDFNLASTAIALATNEGANVIEGVYFSIPSENYEKLYREALRKAVENAKEKAEVIAEALNMEIVGIESVSISGYSVPIWFKGEAAGLPTPKPPMLPGETSIQVTVTVIFLLSPRT